MLATAVTLDSTTQQQQEASTTQQGPAHPQKSRLSRSKRLAGGCRLLNRQAGALSAAIIAARSGEQSHLLHLHVACTPPVTCCVFL